MNAQNESGVRIDRGLVIFQVSLVGRSDFTQLRAGRGDDLADAKAAADLHEFAARNENFLSG